MYHKLQASHERSTTMTSALLAAYFRSLCADCEIHCIIPDIAASSKTTQDDKVRQQPIPEKMPLGHRTPHLPELPEDAPPKLPSSKLSNKVPMDLE
jgi:hypothetical protein